MQKPTDEFRAYFFSVFMKYLIVLTCGLWSVGGACALTRSI